MDDMTELYARNLLRDAIKRLVRVRMNWRPKKARWWMMTANPNLGNVSPNEMILSGRTHKLMAFIENAFDENGPISASESVEKVRKHYE